MIMFKQRGWSRILAAVLCPVVFSAGFMTLSGCDKEEDDGGYKKNKNLDTSESVTLKIVAGYDTWPEMDNVIVKFEENYRNCSVVYERIEDYKNNLPIRLESDEQKIDIFLTQNIQKGNELENYAYNLIDEHGKEILDLSKANQGLVENFRYTDAENTQYAVPFGGELRGMYVNKTLLKKYNLEVPKNRSELLNCCKVLYDAGYIPFQSAPGNFAQQLLYPYICNSIVNGGKYEEMYAAIENVDAGVSEYFRDTYAFLYEIVEKGYYDYKRAEEDAELGYTFDWSTGKARDFLNIKEVSDDTYEKKDDIGKIAFLTDTQAFEPELKKVKSDYHSEIEYEFILSPVGEEGGYAYLSPADGLAVNNKTDNLDWSLEFLNFLFTPEINKAFAAEAGKISNTTDALVQFDVPESRSCDVGKVTFSYPFYKTVTTLLMAGYEDMVGISKSI